MYRFISLLLVLVGLVVLAAGPAMADTILYKDTFTRTGVLAGSTPNVSVTFAGATAGAAYSEDLCAADLQSRLSPGTTWTTDGSKAVLGGATNVVNLPFSPQTGNIYTLSVDMDLSQHDSWALWEGYGRTTGGPILNAAVTWDSGAWGGNKGSYIVPGPGFGGATWDPMYAGGAHTYTTVLDTTNADGKWRASWKIDGVQQGTTYTYATNPTISCLQLMPNGNAITGTLDNYTLSTNVGTPEPSTMALLVTGLVSLLAYAWRKRR